MSCNCHFGVGFRPKVAACRSFKYSGLSERTFSSGKGDRHSARYIHMKTSCGTKDTKVHCGGMKGSKGKGVISIELVLIKMRGTRPHCSLHATRSVIRGGNKTAFT